MDVAFGHCWRCENKITKEVKCSQCGISKYCSDTCCHRDQYRHKPECEEWKPKRCSNPRCTNSQQLVRECSSCNDASYCSHDCIKAHWKDHKHKCRERAQEIRTRAAALQSYFRQRCGTPLATPYYIGNALAIDMLNLEANECAKESQPGEIDPLQRDYKILSSGCGNLRNWVHTAASLPAGFAGRFHTNLNDFDPFVQARNVLQLYMMVKYEDDHNIASSITNIWYSLKLSEKDYNLVVDCLSALLGLTAKDMFDYTRGVILLSEAEMIPMREVWQSWLNLECREGHPDYIDLRKQREAVFRKSLEAAEGIGIYKRELPPEFVRSYDEFVATGIFHPRGSQLRQELRYDNPTLTGYKYPLIPLIGGGRHNLDDIQTVLASPKKLDFVYCVLEDLTPFGSWDYMKVKRDHYNASMTVMFHGYITDQIQQAMKWLQAGCLTVSVIIWNCLDLPVRLNPAKCKLDRIFTSNIADYSGTQPLLQVMKPYLNVNNKCSVLITQYWNWYGVFPDARITAPEAGGLTRMGVMLECAMAAVKDTNIDDRESSLKNPMFMRNEVTKAMTLGSCFFQEYFNYMIYFVSYLRAEFVAFNDSLEDVGDEFRNIVQMQNMIERLGLGRDVACIPKVASAGASGGAKPSVPPPFQKVKMREGLRMRDFKHGELNKVVPFQYRRNVRRVNSFRGLDRMVEWYIP